MRIKKILPLVGIIVLIVIFTTLDLRKIYDIFSSINPLYSLICFFAIIPILLLVNVEWQILLKKQKIKVDFLYSLKNIFIGYFYGFITPGGIGAYTRSLYLQEESKTPLPKCLSNIIIFNTIDYFALLVVGAVGGFFLSGIYPYLFVTICFVMFIVSLLFWFFFKKNKSKKVFTRIIQLQIFSTLKDKLENSVDYFYEDIPRFNDVLLPFILSISGWVLKYLELYLISKLFMIEIPVVSFILILAVADVIASLPVSIYGLGTRELSLITMFSKFSSATVSYEQIVSFSLFIFVIFWLAPSILGGIITFFESNKTKKFVFSKENIKKFERYMKKYPELYKKLAFLVKKNIPVSIIKPVIVDLGVGPGLLSKELKIILPDAEIIGIDPSDEMLRLSERNAEIKTVKGTSENIPLDDKSVDILVSRFSLAYWERPIDSFREIHRVLKPGGRFILEALNKGFSKWRLFLIKLHMLFKGAGLTVANYHVEAYKTAYSIENVEHLFKTTGFKISYREGGDKKDWRFIIVGVKETKQKTF